MADGRRLEITYRAVDSLVPYAKNSNQHSAGQVRQLADSIREFGFTAPVLIAPDGTIVAGHGRVLGAKEAGLAEVPTIELAHLTAEQRRMYVIADNRLAEGSTWDGALLAAELSDLQAGGFDLSITGFSDRELGELMQAASYGGNTHPDEAPALPAEADAVSVAGDIWICGEHRVGCGDGTDSAALDLVMGGGEAAVVWTDPPYNVKYGDKAQALQKYDKGHRNTSRILNDDMSDAEFSAFLGRLFKATSDHMAKGAAVYVAHAETEGVNFRRAFTGAGWKLSSCVIWRKDVLVLGRGDFQWIHEPILYGWKEGAAHRWYGGRKQVSVQDLHGDCAFTPRDDGKYEIRLGDRVLIVSGSARVEELVPTIVTEEKPRRNDLHPTMKPVTLIERMLRWSARPGDVVLDPTGGSGSTLIAAERLGMAARTMDLSAAYVDVIVRRWQSFAGREATHAETGATFAETETARRAPLAA